MRSGPLNQVTTALYATNALVSLAGVALIFYANRKIAQTTKEVHTKWTQYLLHVLALLSLTAMNVMQYFGHKTTTYIAINTMEALLGCFLCYIVWT